MSDATRPDASPAARRRGLLTMTGRDPGEPHRSATPLELLYDLTLVVAFGAASSELAHLLAEGVIGGAVLGFMFVMFAIVWAWLNFTWFASAYDTDDWAFRLLTMVQMVGVLAMALGAPAFLASIAEGHSPDNEVVIAGYVIMRASMVVLWIRAGLADPERRDACFRLAGLTALAQAGWVLSGILHAPFGVELVLAAGLITFEMLTLVFAAAARDRIPWHPHHLAERFGLLTIIALGEGIFGTAAAVAAVVDEQGWSADAALIGVAGVVCTFGMWWAYFSVPRAEILAARRDRWTLFAYGHILLFTAIAAVGAGIHVAALHIEDHSELGDVATVLSVAVPLTVFIALAFVWYALLVRTFDPFHLAIAGGFIALVGAGVGLAALGTSLTTALVVVALAPWTWVLGYETLGRQHMAQHLARLE
ncbi:low temperature requirement protein A [Demequina silvatica]|uniref:low temperature requirement protein A n=1 Tax=Demequina silvatica TaxID=1638988 RepID=UPI000783284A|nr:low temperature requirement protein A [Demequina silvatica]